MFGFEINLHLCKQSILQTFWKIPQQSFCKKIWNMRTSEQVFKTRFYLSFVLSLLSFEGICQKFTLPDIPKYDSIYVDSYDGIVKEKSYFQRGEKVFEIGYNTGSMLYTPFADIGGGVEDSCYAYFNGKNHDEYDFYYIAKSYIVNEKYSETSKIFKYRKFRWNLVQIEQGDFYFIKEMYMGTISHYEKYRIGKWTNFDSEGKPIKTVDYDACTLNNKPIQYKGKLAIIDSLKRLSDKRIIQVYGKSFFTKYVRFNLDQSGYYPYEEPRPEQPGGYSFIEPSEKDIQYVDLSYDIVIGQERFNVIQFRVSRKGQFLGRTYYPGFAAKYFHLTQGLDSLNNGLLHKNVLNWKNIAKAKGFEIASKDFNVRFDFKPTSDYFGELRFVLEQVINSTSSNNSFTNELKQLFINTWTGEMVEKKDEQGFMLETTED
jgi:hypothetical protein